jgi:hypothetical protein
VNESEKEFSENILPVDAKNNFSRVKSGKSVPVLIRQSNKGDLDLFVAS